MAPWHSALEQAGPWRISAIPAAKATRRRRHNNNNDNNSNDHSIRYSLMHSACTRMCGADFVISSADPRRTGKLSRRCNATVFARYVACKCALCCLLLWQIGLTVAGRRQREGGCQCSAGSRYRGIHRSRVSGVALHSCPYHGQLGNLSRCFTLGVDKPAADFEGTSTPLRLFLSFLLLICSSRMVTPTRVCQSLGDDCSFSPRRASWHTRGTILRA